MCRYFVGHEVFKEDSIDVVNATKRDDIGNISQKTVDSGETKFDHIYL